ncbi:putative mitochondrial 2Fe-2S iron-sulfur cluster binding domain containing protein [Leptomonas pyrrhocoris]|uniref:Sulfhydryl oxidase n=1 Tax=Leptomonas pyrrhocoris TaxID=157538 RepID=A0A0M9FSM1_LEPPY|nr:putative mitochondrial 2Fe-2S iron-sulfur cluster binding domain containing protein [Leptomonas pyrrhocoris]KPA75109.1 putative mitochondrial 2Fe-2S iron-sulfur cluster binding domain containing protein [Leptomonas pyrrhocoris]|eukprot:XP_015653548.1 putative mitochondrial 2Fe-2S iron-sulfur cluster binding domain containing protein [Leptomonas pyrrhocoris]
MSGNSAPSKEIPGQCPTPVELGVSGWNILHSSAAVYPYKPSQVQQTAMKNFIESWAHVYACSWCAYHMRDYVHKHPPDVRDKVSVSRYVCELHNEVSARLGKPVFDCAPEVVLRRWHPGYPDKMADKPTVEEQLAMAAKKKADAAAAQRRQQEQEERRFSDFGLTTRDGAPREPAGWRDVSSSASRTNAAGSAGETINDSNTNSSSNDKKAKRWWFFGSSAFNAAPSPSPLPSSAEVPSADSPTAATAAPAESGSVAAGWNSSHLPSAAAPSTLSQTPLRKKAADDETDVDAVLERLKRCQVYCPEDEELLKH